MNIVNVNGKGLTMKENPDYILRNGVLNVGSGKVGRKKELVASKSFTLGLQELVYMEKVCNEKNMKASKFINGLLRKAMLTDMEKEKQKHGPITWCTGCSNYKEYEQKEGKEWTCIDCGDDKTQVITYMLEK